MKKMVILVKILFFIFIIGIVLITSLYLYAFITPKKTIKTTNEFFIYDKNDNLVHQGSSTSEWAKLEYISPYFINAVISVEDKNFYTHQGFDYLRIAKALFLNFKNGKIIQGASTISQQYIKNMYLDFSQTWARKIEEALLTFELEVHYTKEEILEGYLNTINFGQGNYGIENASQYYFNKSAGELTLEEAIILAGTPKKPNTINPVSNYDEAIKRAKIVAKAMLNNKYITEDEYKNLFLNNVEVFGKKSSNNLQTLMYYQDSVIKELNNLDFFSKDLTNYEGIKIYTNLDLDAQSSLEKAIEDNLGDSSMQAASILIEPDTGAILALVGGKDYSVSQYNRATQAKRQVGSAMKPILYYAALENGMTASSTFLSEETTFVFSNNKTYSPANYNNLYANKNITMAAAVAYSDNIYAVKTHLFLGEDVLVDVAKRFGIKENLTPNPSLALGSDEISMIDFANAYNVLASGGYTNDLFFIRKIEDLNGNVLYEKKLKKDLIADPNYVYILNELLTAPYNPAFNDYNTPTNSLLTSRVSRKYSMKSGSTNSDYWMIGYNKDALMLVWTGNDDSSDLKVKDSKISKLIWLDTIESYFKNKDTSWYETPKHVVAKIQNGITGEVNNKNKFLFYYLKGTENTTK